jgi:amino acid transporter
VGATADLTASRLIFASARDNFLPSAFAKLHYSRRTPDNAMALNATLTVFFICFGGGFRCEYCALIRTSQCTLQADPYKPCSTFFQ